MKSNVKAVDKDFLTRKAKGIEKFCLKYYKNSLAYITILHKLNKCVKKINIDDGSLIIDFKKYLKICWKICDKALKYSTNEAKNNPNKKTVPRRDT